MGDIYDFIIVGGGTAGCLLAHRLSHTPSHPSVLLIEAGSQPSGKYLYEPYHRYTPAYLRPDLNYNYTSTPQPALHNRSIPYARGKGLGGSSIINFGVYLYGSAEDYDRWASLVDDASWSWPEVQKSFKQIESYDFAGAEKYPHLAAPRAEDHGSEGRVKVELPVELEMGFARAMEGVLAMGEKWCPDPNSGDPVGVSVFPASYSRDGRTTSAVSFLVDKLENLEVWTGEAVHGLCFEGTRMMGVETAGGKKASARKEVILCGGAIDTPKLLLLNGIGPAKELEELGISVVKDLPGVGKQLHDHVATFLSMEVDEALNTRYALQTDEAWMKQAEEDWARDKTGLFTVYNSGLWGGYLKFAGVAEWPEFQALDEDVREYLSKERTPGYEFCCAYILMPPDAKIPAGSTYLTCAAFLMNGQSEGSITLKSANPEDDPVIDLGYLTHPYDRRALRESIRETYTRMFENPEIKPLVKGALMCPKSLSDEDVDEYARENAITVWHANGTAMMGREDNPLACVDADFKVFGVEGLRVADLSVCPLTTNNHTQATAYLVGQKAADKLIAEYAL